MIQLFLATNIFATGKIQLFPATNIFAIGMI